MTDDRIDELERQNKALEARLDALNKQLNALKAIVIGEERAEVGVTDPEVRQALNLWDRLDGLEDNFEDLERTARSAIATTDAVADGGETTKKALARKKGRNRLLDQLLQVDKAKIRFTKIADEIESTNIYHQTVKDACLELEHKWDAFTVTTDEAGDHVLVATLEKVTDELAYSVEEDLARDGLAKELISRRAGEGVIS